MRRTLFNINDNNALSTIVVGEMTLFKITSITYVDGTVFVHSSYVVLAIFLNFSSAFIPICLTHGPLQFPIPPWFEQVSLLPMQLLHFTAKLILCSQHHCKLRHRSSFMSPSTSTACHFYFPPFKYSVLIIYSIHYIP